MEGLCIAISAERGFECAKESLVEIDPAAETESYRY